ncbi:GDSL-type esterase/lipase family protein [uncultured Dokdonia sp.]|uniref:GDSL-type esterase/lipase family protein n=1 Tax=uncultured Dokdonia sp. TaxID=575653 RepID=UPI00261C9610|nr:GDSL-type esterase/lipase family protein [uncultured Dokdonia sp.]
MNVVLKRKLKFPIYLLSLSILGLVSCEEEDDSVMTLQSFEILAIGDSRVEGHQTDFVSYRYELWKMLKENNKEIDFLGSRIDERIYPDFQEIPFDINHEGKGGDVVGQTFARIDTLLTNTPEMIGNVALIGLGGNDLIQDVPVDVSVRYLNLMISRLQEANESITIFIEQIAPGTTDYQENNIMGQEDYIRLNNAIAELAILRSTPDSSVITVDMTTILTDEDYADDVHYNESGAQKIANQYFEAMQFLF